MTATPTRIGRLAQELESVREASANDGTRCVRVATPLLPRDALAPWMGALSAAHARHTKPGLFVFAVDERRRVAEGWISASDGPRGLTVGRHSACDVFLPGNGSLSLRHLLALVVPHEKGFSTRVLDLLTPGGFVLEDGRNAYSVSYDRFAIVGVPGFWLVFAVTGRGPLFAEGVSPEWDNLPRRTVLDVSAGPVRKAMEASAAGHEETFVTAHRAPVSSLRELELAPGELVAGEVQLTANGRSLRMQVGDNALESGLLLGRYSRCLGSGLLDDHQVSRVHALVLRAGTDVVVVDAGSSNGLYVGGSCVSVALLTRGVEVRLAAGGPALEWCPSAWRFPGAKGMN